MTLAPFDRRGDPPRGGPPGRRPRAWYRSGTRPGPGRGRTTGRRGVTAANRPAQGRAGQALFSAGLVVELELAPSEDEALEAELLSAAFLDLSLSPPPSALGVEGLPRESVR